MFLPKIPLTFSLSFSEFSIEATSDFEQKITVLENET